MSSDLEDTDPRKRLEAAIAIQEGAEGPVDEAADALASSLAFVESISLPAMETLIKMGDEAAAPLVKMARSGPDGFAYPRMFPFDSEDDARARSLALTALWRRAKDKGTADSGAFECFVEGLGHPYAGVRTQALHGLDTLKDPRAVDALKGVLDDESVYIRETAAALIAELEKRGLDGPVRETPE